MTTLTLSDQAAGVVKAAVVSQRRLFEAGRQAYRRRLSAFEHRYGMATTRFLRRFHAGQLNDEPAWFDWLFVHQAHTEFSKRLSLLRGVRL